MADVKISELTALTSPDGAEELVVNDGGTTKKITITNATSASLPKAGGTMTGALVINSPNQATGGSALKIRQGNATTFGIDMGLSQTDGHLNISRVNSGTSTHMMTLARDTGNVGIGTSSPSDNLHLAESGATSSFIRFSNSNVSNGWSLGAGTNGRFQLTQNTVADRLIVDSSGNVLVGKTTIAGAFNTVGSEIRASGLVQSTVDGSKCIDLNRLSSDGDILGFSKAGTSVGSIGTYNGDIYIGTTNGSYQSYLAFAYGGNSIIPATSSGTVNDNALNLGHNNSRFNDIWATNGTIQTSDRNEKQDILAITTAESNVATACKGLLRSFKWKDSVAKKGDDARIHFGIIAQDLQDAFTAEGLDAGRYAMFISSTWWETQTEVPAVEAEDAVYEDVVVTPAQEAGFREVTPSVQAEPAYYDVDGNVIKPAVEASEAVHEATEAVAEVTESRITTEAVEAKDAYTRTDTFETLEDAPEGATERTRMGVRYPELLSFIIAAL